MTKMLAFLKSRQFRKGSAATAVTVLVVAVFVVFNMLISALSDRFSLTLDTTANKAFSLSEESVEFINTLTQDVEVYVLNTEEGFAGMGTYYLQANEIIRHYGRASSRITVTYLDPVREPTRLIPLNSVNPATNDIVVKCGDNLRKIDALYDLFNYSYTANGATPQSSRAEQALTSAILNVTSDDKITVSVLTGHGESGIAEEDALYTFVQLLESNNYNVTTQNLVSEDIDPAAAVAIICAPQRDFDGAELKKLDAFLADTADGNRTLLYMDNAQQPELTALHAFLAEWGIGVGDGIVFENNDNMYVGMYRYYAVVEYSETVYAANAIEKQLPATAYYSRPLEVLFDTDNNITVSTLWNFSQTAGVVPNNPPEDWTPEATGPMPALILSQSVDYSGAQPRIGSVIAAGSEGIVEASVISNSNIANAGYLQSLLNSLNDKEDAFVIADKTLTEAYMNPTGLQILLLAFLFCIALPLAVLITGTVIWLRRRHR